MGQYPYYPPNVAGWGHNAYWLSASSQWAKFAYASYVRWKANERGLFGDTRSLRPEDTVRRSLATFGIHEPADGTVRALVDYVDNERRTTKWAEQPNLILLAIMSPDMQLA
jgi:hypothetical protein